METILNIYCGVWENELNRKKDAEGLFEVSDHE